MSTKWRLLDLGDLPPISTQVVYHAVALAIGQDLSPNTIIFCRPSSPLVCLGYHQELEMEVDVGYCSLKGLPIVRRILGGGAVYLDGDQLFYQVVARRSDPKVPASIQELFESFLAAPAKTYNDIGIPARYRPINDIEVQGRKISGSGATEIGDSAILTGNIIFDFNFDEMTKILKVPSEKFRDKVVKTLRERLTTIQRELTEPPDKESVKELLRRNYEATLEIKLIKGKLTRTEMDLMKSLEEKYRSQEWLYLVENERKGLIQKRSLKISGRTYVGESAHKTQGGLLRVLLETKDNKIEDVMITGDFSFVPQDHIRLLERELTGTEISEDVVEDLIRSFYREHNVESPGLTPKDVACAIALASSN